jgi:hypothetical protein
MHSFKNYYSQNANQNQAQTQNKFIMGNMPSSGENFMMSNSSNNILNESNPNTNTSVLPNLSGKGSISSNNNTNNILIK